MFEEEKINQVIDFIGLMNSYIAGLFVKEQARSKCVGKELLSFAKSIKRSLSLYVYEKNQRAIRFYLREGFAIQSASVDEDTHEKELLMVWSAPLRSIGADDPVITTLRLHFLSIKIKKINFR